MYEKYNEVSRTILILVIFTVREFCVQGFVHRVVLLARWVSSMQTAEETPPAVPVQQK